MNIQTRIFIYNTYAGKKSNAIMQDKELQPFYYLFTHSQLTVYYFTDTAPQHSYKEKPQERKGAELDLVGL